MAMSPKPPRTFWPRILGVTLLAGVAIGAIVMWAMAAFGPGSTPSQPAASGPLPTNVRNPDLLSNATPPTVLENPAPPPPVTLLPSESPRVSGAVEDSKGSSIAETPAPSRKSLDVEIARITPAEPRVGENLVIELRSNAPEADRVVYEYRTDPAGPWRVAADGKLTVSSLPEKLLVLEIRAKDSKGTISPVLTRTLAVKPIPMPPRPVAAKPKEEKLYQELVVVQKPVYRVHGLELVANIQYTVVSSITLDKQADGSLVLRQKVEAARLDQADPLTAPLLADPIKKLPGTVFTITLNPQREVTKFEGHQEMVQVAGGNLLAGQPFQMASLLDKDGWKELTQSAFFAPERPLRAGERWDRKLTHGWGPLGSWTGQALYAHSGTQGAVHRIAYVLNLAYQPPKGAGALPFQIGNAAFKCQEAGGNIYYDADKARVVAVEERFRVQGVLSISLLGQNVPIELAEEQTFRLRMTDQNPMQK